MTLRARIAAVAGLAVAVAVIASAAGLYLAVGSDLRGQIDRSLRQRAQMFLPRQGGGGPRAQPGGLGGGAGPAGGGPQGAPSGRPGGAGAPGGTAGLPESVTPAPFGGASGYVQFVSRAGAIQVPAGQGSSSRRITPGATERAVAARGSGSAFTDRTVDSTKLRILTVGAGSNGALMIARPLTEVNRDLEHILLILIIVGGGGIALAAILGALVARTALAPIVGFTRRTESLSDSLGTSQRLEVRGRDELARLAASFNATLAALESSVESQRQLVADASHELRTPIAALRTNIQVLEEADRLSPEDQASLRRDIVGELDELTWLVADMVELARGARGSELSREEVRLDQIVSEAAQRARRRGEIQIRADLAPTLVSGEPERIGRAVTNLLENARKWSPPEGLVEIGLREGVLRIRDHGPGFEEADLPHVFERFYRAERARRLPGSGLGLAIVRQTAEAHQGWVRASNAPEGGAVIEISFGPWEALPAASPA